MTAPLAPSPLAASPRLLTPRRIARLRAVVALVWAAALAIAVGDDAGSDVSFAVAALVTLYPVIDVVASLSVADRTRLLQLNATISALAAAALAVAGFGADEGTVLAVFGAWALVSGAIQLATAIRRRRAGARELPMILSGAISVLAGVSFIASSQADDPNLTSLAGYAALGAVFFLVWAQRTRTSA